MLNSYVTLSESEVIIAPCINALKVIIPWLVVSVSVKCVTFHVETSTYSSNRIISCLWSGLLGVNPSNTGGVVSAVKPDTFDIGMGLTGFPAVSKMVKFCNERYISLVPSFEIRSFIWFKVLDPIVTVNSELNSATLAIIALPSITCSLWFLGELKNVIPSGSNVLTPMGSENAKNMLPVSKLRLKDDSWGGVESAVKSEGRMAVGGGSKGFPLVSVILELVRNRRQLERLVHTCWSALMALRTCVAIVTTISVAVFSTEEMLLDESA